MPKPLYLVIVMSLTMSLPLQSSTAQTEKNSASPDTWGNPPVNSIVTDDTNNDATGDHWRRTIRGWEWLEPATPAPQLFPLHPLVVTSLFALTALLAYLCESVAADRQLDTQVVCVPEANRIT